MFPTTSANVSHNKQHHRDEKRSKTCAHLSIKVVSKTIDKLTLNWVLPSHQTQVVAQLVMGCDDCSVTKLVKLWAACTAKDLHHIQNAQVNKRTSLCIIDLGTLYACKKKKNHPVNDKFRAIFVIRIRK